MILEALHAQLAEQHRTNDVLRALVDVIKNPSPVLIREVEREKVSTRCPVDTSGQSQTLYTSEKIIEDGKVYTRETHPLLFAVVDWLELHPDQQTLGVRPIASAFEAGTGVSVSKSWAAVAKNYHVSKR